MSVDPEALTKAIKESWEEDTASKSSGWSPENRARGQCVPTALVVQDYVGRDLEKFLTNFDGKEESHYRNKLDDGTVIDLAREQYPADQELWPSKVDLKGAASIREKRLKDPGTRKRYELLRDRVDQLLKNPND